MVEAVEPSFSGRGTEKKNANQVGAVEKAEAFFPEVFLFHFLPPR